MITQSPYMELAIAEAEQAFERDEVPVGAVITVAKSGEVIAISGNRCEELGDPTAHAEMLAIRMACEKLGQQRLIGCNIYVTLEPCPMCAQAISFARIDALYYGAEDLKSGGVTHGARIFSASSSHHKPEIYSGIHEEGCSELLTRFFKEKRK